MRIIENNVLRCNCGTNFEFSDNETVLIPGYSCMRGVACPKCHQMIYEISDTFREVSPPIEVTNEE
jgi:hypothetical protein